MQRLLKRGTAWFMAALTGGVVIAAPIGSITAVAADTPQYDGVPIITGQYMMPLTFTDGEYEDQVFYYSDGYFNDSSSEYNEHLSTMSLNLAISTAGQDIATEVFDEIGFEDICFNSAYTKEDTADTIGDVIASKELTTDGTTVVAVAVRGLEYTAEWANNVIVGDEGDAKGLTEATKTVRADLNDYLDTAGIDAKNAKFWIVGFSRGAAIADILSNELNEEYGADSVYGYCFAAPMEASKDNASADVENIHVIVNRDDMITHLMPESFGFTNYGKRLDVNDLSDKKAMEKQLELIDKSLISDEFAVYSMDISGLFLNEDESTLADKDPEDITKKDIKEAQNDDPNNLLVVEDDIVLGEENRFVADGASAY